MFTRGYIASDVMRSQISTRQKVLLVRSSQVKELVDTFPEDIEEIRANQHFRATLRHRKTGTTNFARAREMLLYQHWQELASALSSAGTNARNCSCAARRNKQCDRDGQSIFSTTR